MLNYLIITQQPEISSLFFYTLSMLSVSIFLETKQDMPSYNKFYLLLKLFKNILTGVIIGGSYSKCLYRC